MNSSPFVRQWVWVIWGLSCLATACVQEGVTGQWPAHLAQLSPTPAVKAVSLTPAPTSGIDLFTTVTSFPTPTEQDISGACEVVFSLEGWKTQGAQGTRFFAVAPDSSVWIADYHYPGRLLRFSLAGELLQEILESGEYYLLDLDVTQTGIWLLEVVTPFNNASYVAHLGFDGLLRNRYEVPKKFYVKADGQYANFGSGSIEWGGNGELLIETETGLHQLLDANGNLRPMKLVGGYTSDGHICRVENGVDGLSTAGALFYRSSTPCDYNGNGESFFENGGLCFRWQSLCRDP